MSTATATATSATEILAQIGQAFRAHDAAAIGAMFAEDGVFINAVGDLHGDTYRGPAQVQAYFTKIFAETPDAAWVPRAAPLLIGDDQAVTQWHRVSTDRNGVKKEWFGVDLYAFRDGKVTKKDTYIKNVTTG